MHRHTQTQQTQNSLFYMRSSSSSSFLSPPYLSLWLPHFHSICQSARVKGRFHMTPLWVPSILVFLVSVALCCVAVIMEVITLVHVCSTAAAAAQADCGTVTPAARPHPHKLWRITVKRPAHCHTETQTPGNKMVFVYEVIESLWIFVYCSFHSPFIPQLFHQAWMCCTVSVGFAGFWSYGIAEISCPWANILLHFWPSNTKWYNLCSAGLQLIQGNRRADDKEHGGNVWVPLEKKGGQRNGNAEQHISTKPEMKRTRMCIWHSKWPGEVKKEDK